MAIVIQIKVNTLAHNLAKTESYGEETSELELIRLKSRQRVFQTLIILQLGKAFPTSMKSKIQLPRAKYSATCPSPKPDDPVHTFPSCTLRLSPSTYFGNFQTL